MRTLGVLLILLPSFAFAHFDHSHAQWTEFLAANVVWIDDGHASQVRYARIRNEHDKLKAYLDSLSAVSRAQFDGWTKPQQLAFLINAYNAFTIEKVLTRYPNLDSIRDFGSLIGNPWKDRFFALLGTPMSLDGIEHDTIRKPGAYDEPRIHFAVNCASIGCPALRNEAYTADRLDDQLEDQTKRFLADRTRNRYVAKSGTVEVSKIFDWYVADFLVGSGSVSAFLARHADELADTAEDREAIREGRAKVTFLAYDWALNDAKQR